MMCHWKKDGTALTTPTWHTVHTRGFVVRCIAGLTEWALLMRLTPAISETVMTTHTTLHWMLPWLPVYGFIGCCTDGRTDCVRHTTACEHQQDYHHTLPGSFLPTDRVAHMYVHCTLNIICLYQGKEKTPLLSITHLYSHVLFRTQLHNPTCK